METVVVISLYLREEAEENHEKSCQVTVNSAKVQVGYHNADISDLTNAK
jgi:hypothetical protein